jgi:hypothetical protein
MAMPDPKEFRDMIDDPNMTDEQKDEMVIALWGIATQIVDFVYGDHPFQMCQKHLHNQTVN